MTTPESELFDSQAHLRAVLDTMLDGLVITDASGIVRVFNPACERLFGYPADEVVGRNVAMLISPAERRSYQESLERSTASGVPKIVGRQREIEARRRDGSDFPVSVSIGEAEVEGQHYFIGVVHDLTQEIALRRDATIDPLTGALNRRDFLSKASAEVARAERYGRVCALLMLDVDHFKDVNDRYGHAAGDEALRRFTATCKDILRKNDIFGRIGGEEFAVILPETALDGARKLAERLRKRIADVEIASQDQNFTFTVSIGVAELASSDKGIETFMQRADRALYEAKERGRDRVVVADAA